LSEIKLHSNNFIDESLLYSSLVLSFSIASSNVFKERERERERNENNLRGDEYECISQLQCPVKEV
jgi:hypothetical protein